MAAAGVFIAWAATNYVAILGSTEEFHNLDSKATFDDNLRYP
jgi:hypothetical protein